MAALVRALDVGFGNTKFTTSDSRDGFVCRVFPSLAFYGGGDRTDGLGGKRKTVVVPVNGLNYEVGPDVELAADRYRSRHLHDEYTDTDEYRALCAGAIAMMKVEAIDLLVVGLPVAQYQARRASLQRSLTGPIPVGQGRTVEIRRVLAVAQPQGALIDFATREGGDALAKGRSLVVDVGSRTFDWLVTRGMKVVTNMSSSVTRGVSDIHRALAKCLSDRMGVGFNHYEAIDEALRSNRKLRAYQKEYDLREFDRLVQTIADDAVLAIIQQMDSTHDVENIVLVGGGAFLFQKAIKRRFPLHRIRAVDESIFANVRGFQLIGEQYAAEKGSGHAEQRAVAAPAPTPSAPAFEGSGERRWPST